MSDVNFAIIAALSREIYLQPYAPSDTMTKFFFKDEKRSIFVELFKEWVNIDGFVSAGSLVLPPEKLLDFFIELEKVLGNLFGVFLRVSKVEERAIRVFPRIEYGIAHFGEDPPRTAKKVIKHFKETVSKLEKIEHLIDEFRTHDISSETLDKIWSEAKLEKDKNKKGELLEKFVSLLVTLDKNFTIEETNVRTESEEIDVVIKNNGYTQFYAQLQSPMILLECKNWTSNISAKEVRDFVQKVQNRPRVLCKVGVLLTTSTFTKDAIKELIGYRGRDFTIATIDGDDIKTLIKRGPLFSELLESKIISGGLR